MRNKIWLLVVSEIISGLLFLTCSSSDEPLSDNLPVTDEIGNDNGEVSDDDFPPLGIAEFGKFMYQAKNDWNGKYNAESQYLNPILPGSYPDPSICRAGRDYYIVNSSFAYFPGIPIWHSTDLVHWNQLGHVLNRPTQLLLQNTPISGGIYASDIKYNPFNRQFYVITCCVGCGGTFYVKTDDPKKNNWSEPIKLPEVGGIDPAFLFDTDGKAYIVNNDNPEYAPLYGAHKAIWIREFDWKNDKVIGEARVIVDGGVDINQQPSWIEGPHLYHIGDKYYLMAAEGGTGPHHREVIFSSNSPWGPFVPCPINPILTQKDLPSDRKNQVTCAGHADLVQTQSGDWMAVFLAVRPQREGYENTGRETFMLPVDWNEEQPIILSTGKEVPFVVDMTLEQKKMQEQEVVEYYDPYKHSVLWKDNSLTHDALFIRTPLKDFYTVENGRLRLPLRKVKLNEMKQPSFIGRRVNSANFTIETDVKFIPRGEEDFAGVACFLNDDCYILFGKTVERDSGESILLLEAYCRKSNETESKLVHREEYYLLKDEVDRRLCLQVKTVDQTAYAFSYTFGNSKEWRQLGAPISSNLVSTSVAGGYMGTMIGVYATGVPVPSVETTKDIPLFPRTYGWGTSGNSYTQTITFNYNYSQYGWKNANDEELSIYQYLVLEIEPVNSKIEIHVLYSGEKESVCLGTIGEGGTNAVVSIDGKRPITAIYLLSYQPIELRVKTFRLQQSKE